VERPERRGRSEAVASRIGTKRVAKALAANLSPIGQSMTSDIQRTEAIGGKELT
jgi:hypothetical protein